ncbi:MAG: bifunctional heptose 7-phosphate kinase/heptose 1-phosphate adenyltransferase, partial [Calditrichia bacterium]
MLKFSESRLREIFSNGAGKKIIVFGDLMVDRYLWGNVSRISPEAPVPIINIEDEEIRFGGAANVANNLIGLGAVPILVGVIGEDMWGEAFHALLKKKSLPGGGLLVDKHRPTTIKTRIIGNNQHIARVDREKMHPVNSDLLEQAYQFIRNIINEIDGIILQDYNKGMIVPDSIHRIIELANRHNKIITVDPKENHFPLY